MKKILLCLVCFVSLGAFAQVSFQVLYQGSPVVPNSTINANTSSGQIAAYTFDIKNTSASSKSYNVKRYDVLLNASASETAAATFCFAGTCWAAGTHSAGPVTLNAGQSASELAGTFNMLVTDLQEITNPGISYVKYTFINSTTTSDSVQWTIAYNAPSRVIENANLFSSFELSPNPVNDFATLKINSSKAVDGRVYVYNALGSQVMDKSVSLLEGKNKIEFSAEDLSSGIYFVSLKSGNSTLTRRFIVK